MTQVEQLAGKLRKKYPSINFHKGFEYFLHNLEFYEKYLKKFFDRYSGTIEEIKMDKENGNLSSIAKTVHTIKGSAGYLGAEILFSKATEVENCLLKNPMEIDEKLDNFLNELKEVLASINQLLPFSGGRN